MKVKTKKILLIALTCTCEKEETENPLPTNTEIGANTFIFRVNGGEIIESEVGYLPISPRIRVFYNHVDTILNRDFHFEIRGCKIILEHNKTAAIVIKTMPVSGKYILSENDNYSFYFDHEPDVLSYYTDNNHKGELDVTKLDTVNHIISGKFKFDAKRHFNGEELEEYVTVEGQFDIRYKPNRIQMFTNHNREIKKDNLLRGGI